jgi:cation-transporting ATPase 13A1
MPPTPTADQVRLSPQGDRQHMVFGGTKVLQVVPSTDDPVFRDRGGLPRPPDGGCLAVVLRNGFNTSQGRLVRTILFSSDQTTAASREAGIFILCLLCFALAASGYVLSVSWEDPRRKKGKLLINCSMIIASVVPPELPMNLTLAVNSSLHSLAQLGVFCTEPFRIPYAGLGSLSTSLPTPNLHPLCGSLSTS